MTNKKENLTLTENTMVEVQGTNIEIEYSYSGYDGIWIKINGEELILIEKEQENHVIRVWNSGNDMDDYEYKQVIK